MPYEFVIFTFGALCLVLGWVLRGSHSAVTKTDLRETESKIIMKLSELAGNLKVLGDHVEKVRTEVQSLKDSLTNTELPQDAQDSLDRLSALVKSVDDITPDA